LWDTRPKCSVFASVDSRPSLNAEERSDPYVLAYVDLYCGMDISGGEAPEFMAFDEYDGAESIDYDSVRRNKALHEARRHARETAAKANKNRQTLLEAQKLATSLLSGSPLYDAGIVARLAELVNTMTL